MSFSVCFINSVTRDATFFRPKFTRLIVRHGRVSFLQLALDLFCLFGTAVIMFCAQMPVIPRCRIRSTLYFDSHVLQRLSLIQQRFFAMRPIIRLCPQKKELRNMLGSRYYLLHEEDLIFYARFGAYTCGEFVVRKFCFFFSFLREPANFIPCVFGRIRS